MYSNWSDHCFLCFFWRRQWDPTPVLLPGKSHGWRSVVGYSPWGHKKSDRTNTASSPLPRNPHWPILLSQPQVPWTERRSNQSIPKEISPEYSLEGLKLKLRLQYFGHLMPRVDSLEKTLMLGKTEGRRGRQRTR